MTVAAFLLICVAVKVTRADLECENAVSCPCGSNGVNVTICADSDADVCTRVSKCKTCEEGSDVCSECPEGFGGPLCFEAVTKTCENPGPISNGRIRFSLPTVIEGSKMEKLAVHTVLEYVCVEGYRLEGPKYLTCNQTGLWSAEVPTCIKDDRLQCENRKPISNGKLQYSHPDLNVGAEMKKLPMQTVINYSCDEGYRLVGSSYSSTCLKCSRCTTPDWDPDDQKCKIDCGRGFFNYGPCILKGCRKHTPWVVSISVEDDNGFRHVCFGALLNYQTVVTAAHCLVEHSNIFVQFGKHRFGFRNDEPQMMVRKSSRMILHPNFSNMTFDSNIGLLFFEPKIRFTADVQPICLLDYWNTNQDSKVGKSGIVNVARELNNAFSTGSMTLRRMTALSVKECLETTPRADLFITKNSFCAGNKDDYQSVCVGDSGAPFFSYDRYQDRFMLEGIANFGIRPCNEKGNYAVFTKIDNFMKWIKENLE